MFEVGAQGVWQQCHRLSQIRVAVAVEIGGHHGDLVEAGLNRLAGRATRTPAVQPALVKHKFRYDFMC